MKYIKVVVCCLCLLFSFISRPQELLQGMKQTLDMNIDNIGNADIEVTTHLDASAWDNYKHNIGENTSLLKRNMERALPTYYLSDFHYSEEPMERTYEVKFKALGICSMNRNGTWEAKLDTQKPEITKVSNREFVMNQDLLTNGMLVQQTIKLHLPPEAKNAKVEKDSFGKAELTYITGQGLTSEALTALGILLILSGGWLFYKNIQTKKQKGVVVSLRRVQNEPSEEMKKQAIRNSEIEAKQSEDTETHAV